VTIPWRMLSYAMPSLLPQAVLDYLAAYQSGNTSQLQHCLAADVLFVNVTEEAGMRTDGIAGVAQIIKGVHEMLADVKITITEQHVDNGTVRIAGVLDATSQKTILGGFQYGQHVRLPIRLAFAIKNGRITKVFESS
jgi:predicted ester cyclase